MSWIPIIALPNIDVRCPVEGRYAAIMGYHDERVAALCAITDDPIAVNWDHAETCEIETGDLKQLAKLSSARGIEQISATAFRLHDASSAEDIATLCERARLDFAFVPEERKLADFRLLVMDIGGGSLELACGLDEEPDVAVSAPLGAGRLTRSHLTSDPPAKEQIGRAHV